MEYCQAKRMLLKRNGRINHIHVWITILTNHSFLSQFVVNAWFCCMVLDFESLGHIECDIFSETSGRMGIPYFHWSRKTNTATTTTTTTTTQPSADFFFQPIAAKVNAVFSHAGTMGHQWQALCLVACCPSSNLPFASQMHLGASTRVSQVNSMWKMHDRTYIHVGLTLSSNCSALHKLQNTNTKKKHIHSQSWT